MPNAVSVSYSISIVIDVAVRVLSGIEEIGFSYLTSSDVVRHPLVQKIVMAYDNYEKRQQRGKNTAVPGVVFWASSRMIKALSRVRPLI